MDKHNAKTRKRLKQISSVKDFESLMEQTMLSEEEKKIYRICEELNGTGYDLLYIVEIQKQIHDEYKNKMKKLKIQKQNIEHK